MGVKFFISLCFCLCFAGNYLYADSDIPLKPVAYPSEWEFDSKFYLLKNEIMHQAIGFYGTTRGIKEAKLILDLPEGMELLYAFHTPTGNGRPTYQLKEPILCKPFKRGKKLYKRCVISLREDLLKKGVAKNTPSPWTHLNLFLYFKSNLSSGKSKLYYYTEVDGKKGKEKVLECVFLPPLEKITLPEKIKFYAICGGDLSCPNKEVWEGIYSLYNKIGIKGCYQHFPAYISKELAKRGWLILSEVGYGWDGWWVYSPQEVIKPGIKPDEILATLRNGQKTKNPRIICPTYLIENGENGRPFFELLKKRVKGRVSVPGVGGIFDDFEQEWFREHSAINSCFCPRCKKAFFEYSGIETEKLSPEEILSKYKEQWFNFRVWQNSQMVRILSEVIKEVNPKLKFILCSAPITWGRLPQQGFDIRTFDQYIDEFWPMAYETNMALMYIVDATVKVFNKPVIPILNTCYPFREHNAFPPDEVMMNILASVTSGAKGIAFFTGTTSLDGAYIKAIAQAEEKIAVLENFFVDGVRDDSLAKIEVKEWNGIRHRVHRLGQCLLLSLFNYSPKEDIFLKISLPQIENGNFFLYEPTEKILYLNSERRNYWKDKELKEGFVFKLNKSEVKFLLISPGKLRKTENYRKVRINTLNWRRKYKLSLVKRKRNINKYLIASHPEEIYLNGKNFVKIKCKGLDKNDEFTISLWAYMEDRGIDEMIYRNPMVSWENQQGSVTRFTITNAGRLSFATTRCGEAEVTSHFDKILSPGKWYHLTIAYKKGIARLFINGKQPPDGINCIKSKLFPEGEEIFIGKDKWNRFFKGRIKEVKIYNKALYAEEIKNIFRR